MEGVLYDAIEPSPSKVEVAIRLIECHAGSVYASNTIEDKALRRAYEVVADYMGERE